MDIITPAGESRILINKSAVLTEGLAFTVKVGMESLGNNRWRVWYIPLTINQAQEIPRVYLLAPPGGLTVERARSVAAAVLNLLTTTLDQCLAQAVEDSSKPTIIKSV